MDLPNERETELHQQAVAKKERTLAKELTVNSPIAHIVRQDDGSVLAKIVSLSGQPRFQIESLITQRDRDAGEWVQDLDASIDDLNQSFEDGELFPDRNGKVSPLRDQPIDDVCRQLNQWLVRLLKGKVYIKKATTSHAAFGSALD